MAFYPSLAIWFLECGQVISCLSWSILRQIADSRARATGIIKLVGGQPPLGPAVCVNIVF